MGTGRAYEQILMLEHAGAEYTVEEVSALPDTFPCFAPPMVKFPDGLLMGQTTAINVTLGKQLGFYPEGDADEAHALQVSLNVSDMLADELLHKSKTKAEFVESCAEGARNDKWLKNLESILASTGTGFAIGSKLTYADFAVYSITKAYADLGDVLGRFPKLVAHKAMVSEFPKVKAFDAKSIPYLPAGMGPQ